MQTVYLCIRLLKNETRLHFLQKETFRDFFVHSVYPRICKTYIEKRIIMCVPHVFYTWTDNKNGFE